MIKYPLYLTIDTNIFEAKRYNFSSDETMKLLVKNIKNEKVKLVLSNVVIREIENHIIEYVDQVYGTIRKSRKEALRLLPEPYLNDIGLSSYLIIPNKEELHQNAKVAFYKFLTDCEVERLSSENVDLEKVLDDYFCIRAPFEKSEKKRKEFPDAIIAEELYRRFSNGETVAIVSEDNGFRLACSNISSSIQFSSLEELYDYLNKNDSDYSNARELVNKNYARIKQKLENSIDDSSVIVYGKSIDSDGIIEGYDYDETNIKNLELLAVKLHTINDIENDSVFISIWVDCNMTVDCFFDDYDNSCWDSVDKEYVYIKQRHIIERHKAKFACRLTISRKTEEISVMPFNIVLGGDSIVEREEVE